MVKRTVSLASAPSRSSINVFVTFVAIRSPFSSRRVFPTPTERSARCPDRRLQATQAGSQGRDINTSLNGTSVMSSGQNGLRVAVGIDWLRLPSEVCHGSRLSSQDLTEML